GLVDAHAFSIPGGPTRDVLETDHLLGVDGRRHRRGGHGWPRAAAEAGGDLLVNGQGGAEHDDAPRGVLQLTDVARPVILEEDAHGVSRDFDFASVLGSELGEEMTDEHRDLLAPLAQRGDPDLEDVQAVVQIFPELMGLHRGLEVTVGGRDEPHVGANDLLPTDAGEFAVLQDVQQLGLELQRDLADLVEEERALIHRLEFAGLLPVGARECALLVTEQLVIEQLAGKRRAIHLQELPMDARRRQVNGPGHDFLADSALTLQQYGDVESGHLRDQVPNRLHVRRVRTEASVWGSRSSATSSSSTAARSEPTARGSIKGRRSRLPFRSV